MQNQQNPNPNQPKPTRPENDVERGPAQDKDSNRAPAPDRHPDPLRQPGDVPDVKPDVIAGQQRRGTNQSPSQPDSAQRRKQ